MTYRNYQAASDTRRSLAAERVIGDLAFVLSYFDKATQKRWINALSPKFKKSVRENIVHSNNLTAQAV